MRLPGFPILLRRSALCQPKLKTFDIAVVTLPNRSVWGSPMVNYTREPVRRVTIDVGVAYGTDLNEAISTLLSIARANEMILNDPPHRPL